MKKSSEAPEFSSGTVAVVGRSNVGKSTLTNLLVGEKVAIVSNIPQTTRMRIRGICNRPHGQIVIVDTPGFHKPHHVMNRLMVAASTAAMSEVDLVLFMIEVSQPNRRRGSAFGPGDRFMLSRLPRSGPPVVLAINKIDRIAKPKLLPIVSEASKAFPFEEIFLLSALTGENTQDLGDHLLAHLPRAPPLFAKEFATDQPARFLAAEIIREKILLNTREEIPHETCVIVESYDEGEKLIRIEATILVERESQRGIVIGREGSFLKMIGTLAREELEVILDKKVFLNLWAKVRGGWRDDSTILKRLGLGDFHGGPSS